MAVAGKLDGKVALITGSGYGIGRATALELAAEGARVVVNDLDSGPTDDVVSTIKAMGDDAVVFAGSVTAADFVERYRHGRADLRRLGHRRQQRRPQLGQRDSENVW
nr:SDR family NAD(P)-dependent oxidoreductase [Solimonas terrae]